MRRAAPSGVSQRSISPRQGHEGAQCSPSISPHLAPESRLLVPPQQKNMRGAANSAHSFSRKTSVDSSGGPPPIYALASGALYGSTTSSPKYVLTQIALLQSAFYLVYALLSLVALTFLIDLGDEASSLPSAGDGLLLVLEGDVAPKSPSAGQSSPVIRSSSPGAVSAPNEGSANPAGEEVQPFLPKLGPPETSGETDLSPKETRNDEVQGARKQSDSARQQDRLPGREQPMESKRKRGYKGLRRSHVLFETKLYSFLTKEGRVLLLVFFLTSLAMSYLVFLVVERARKCLDFCFSIHFLHFLACWALSGFPHQLSWWLCSLAGAIATTALSQFLCQRVELQEIRLERASTPSPPLRVASLSETQTGSSRSCTFRLPAGVAVSEQSQARESKITPTAPQVYGLPTGARDRQCLQTDNVGRAPETEARENPTNTGIELRIL